MGFGALALGSMLGAGRSPSARRGGQSAPAASAPLPGEGQARHPPVHERRAVARRHVRPQAGARASTPASRCRWTTCRPSGKTGAALPSPFKFQKYGQSGIEVSELFPHVAERIDDICVIRSMHADVPNHEPSLLLMNCGDARQIRPSLGSWLCYGLGSENQNLPAFVAMCPGGYPIQETQNWQIGLPARRLRGHVHRHAAHRRSSKLIEHIRNDRIASPRAARSSSTCCERSTAATSRRGSDDAALEARIQSFELGFRMQTEAAEAFDVSREPQHIRDMYGAGVAGPADPDRPPAGRARRALRAGLARRRPAVGQPRRHRSRSPQARRANATRRSARCSIDLKQRGLLDDTLVIWGGEFGRTPSVELPKKAPTRAR